MEKLIERWSKLPPKQRYAAIAGVIVALMVGYYFLYHTEQVDKLQRLEQQHMSLENQRAEKQAYADNLEKYEARFNELLQKLNDARSKLPDAADVPQLLAQLGNTARQSGLWIEKFEPKGETVKDFVAEISFSMQVRGSYHEIGSFMDAVGRLDRIINISEVSLVNPITENQKIVLTSDFKVKTFRFVGGNQIGAP